MGVTREDLIRKGRWLEVSDAEWQQQYESVKHVTDGYAWNDKWSVKIKKNVGVLLTGSIYGRPFLKASVGSHKRLGYWTVLSYDNFVNPTLDNVNYNEWMPPKDVMDNLDSFIITHPYQNWGGVSYPYIFQLRIASGIFHSFDYVLVDNSDCIIEKPEGLSKIIEMMGDADLISAGPNLPREIGTASFLIRSSAFMAVAKHMNDHVVPFEEYEKSTQEFGNTEGRFSVAVKELGLKTVDTVVPGKCSFHDVCEQFHEFGHGTWYDLLGFRHIHGELNFAHRYGRKLFRETGKLIAPPPSSYLDARYCGNEDMKAALAYESGDIEFVKNWYAQE